MTSRKIPNLVYRSRTNTTFGLIDHALIADIVARISNEIEVRNDIADFLAAIELSSAHHGIGNIGLEQGFFHRT